MVSLSKQRVSAGARVPSRALQVLDAARRHLLSPRLRRVRTPARAARMQAFLEELGGAWVKLGQGLALRFDLLPADYCLQFFRLLNQIRPFAAGEVRRVLERELGQPVERVFRSFDWQPLAAASIGQVHRAELPDGTAVAVKVQRPGVRALIRADLRLMRLVAAVVDRIPFVGVQAHARDFVAEFARWTEEELDYRIEAAHLAVLRANAAEDPLERHPRVHRDYTTEQVLTLDYLEGVPVIDIVDALRRDDTGFLADLAARGHDPRRIASHIVWNSLNQIYRFGYFHADPHPANLVVLANDAIGYVDFGIVGKLDEQTTESLRRFAQNLFAGRVGAAVDEFLRFLTPSPHTDLAVARRDLIAALTSYLDSERVAPGGRDLAAGAFEIEMLALVRKHAMALAPDAVRYLKAVLTAEATVRELDPQFDLRGHENRFFARLTELEVGEALSPGRAAQWVAGAALRLERLLESVEEVGKARAGVELVTRRMVGRVRALTAATVLGWAVVLALAFAPPAGFAAPGGWALLRRVTIGAALVGLSALLVVLARLRRQAARRRAGFAPRDG